MEETRLKILKQTQKKVNSALILKSFNTLCAIVSAWCACGNLYDAIEKGYLISIPASAMMFYWYIRFLKWSRKEGEIISNNLEIELDLEEELEGNLKR